MKIIRLLSEVIDDLEDRVSRLEEYIGVETEAITYGIVKRYKSWDLYFEAITDTKDAFVMKDKNGNIIGIFPESE